jgi:hypothetical protein
MTTDPNRFLKAAAAGMHGLEIGSYDHGWDDAAADREPERDPLAPCGYCRRCAIHDDPAGCLTVEAYERENVIVVVNTEADTPQLLGSFMRVEEDTVMYDEGGLGSPVGRAPYDCVKIMPLAEYEALQDRGPTAAEFDAAADAHDAWKAARANGEAPED